MDNYYVVIGEIMNPAIEQAVKAIQRTINDLRLFAGVSEAKAKRADEIANKGFDAFTSLRALAEPVAVSKTDEELARELMDELWTIGSPSFGKDKMNLSLITQAFTAIRAQARSEALDKVHDRIVLEIIEDKRHTLEERNGARMASTIIRELKATK